MDRIWYRNPLKLEVTMAVVAGMKKPNAKKEKKKRN